MLKKGVRESRLRGKCRECLVFETGTVISRLDGIATSVCAFALEIVTVSPDRMHYSSECVMNCSLPDRQLVSSVGVVRVRLVSELLSTDRGGIAITA